MAVIDQYSRRIVGFAVHAGVLDGQIDPFVNELRTADEAERLREAGLEEQGVAAD